MIKKKKHIKYVLLLTWFCNSFFRLELECILPGGELDITNG